MGFRSYEEIRAHEQYVANVLKFLFYTLRTFIVQGYSKKALEVESLELNGNDVSHLVVKQYYFDAAHVAEHKLTRGFDLRLIGKATYGVGSANPVCFGFNLCFTLIYDGDVCKKIRMTCLIQDLTPNPLRHTPEGMFNHWGIDIRPCFQYISSSGAWYEKQFESIEECKNTLDGVY